LHVPVEALTASGSLLRVVLCNIQALSGLVSDAAGNSSTLHTNSIATHAISGMQLQRARTGKVPASMDHRGICLNTASSQPMQCSLF
jgi:hypothetical protein